MTHYTKKGFNDNLLLRETYEKIANLPQLRWIENNKKSTDEGGIEKMSYVYVLEDFAYSDFEYFLLTHEKHFSDSEFKNIVKEVIKKTEKQSSYSYMFHRDLFKILEEEYGFEDGDETVPVFHIDDLIRELEEFK